MSIKLWQLFAVMREEKEILLKIISQPQWEEYYQYYKDEVIIIKEQKREILDIILPENLVNKVLSLSKRNYYFDSINKIITSYETILSDKSIPILDVCIKKLVGTY